MTKTSSNGEHAHDFPPDFDIRVNSIEETASAALGDAGAAATLAQANSRLLELVDERLLDIEGRLTKLELPQVPFTADWWVSNAGSDSNPGTKDLPFKTLPKAVATASNGQGTNPVHTIALLQTPAPIEGGDFYDRRFRLVAAPGHKPTVQGNSRAARFQRCNGSYIDPAITWLPPRTLTNPRDEATGIDTGATRQATVEITNCHDMTGGITSAGGSDFAVQFQLDNFRNVLAIEGYGAAAGLMLKGNGGQGDQATRLTVYLHDNHWMIRNTPTPTNDDNGAIGVVWENATGYVVKGVSERNFSKAVGSGKASYDYISDGGNDVYDAVGVTLDLVVRDCQGGFETGGSSGKGCSGMKINLVLEGDMAAGMTGAVTDGVGVIWRNARDSEITIDATKVTRALYLLDIGGSSGYAGSIENSKVTLKWKPSSGLRLYGNNRPSPTTVVTIVEVA